MRFGHFTVPLRLLAAAIGLAAAAIAVPAKAAEGAEAGFVAGSGAAAYCAGVVDAAADARIALQMQALSAMEKELEARIADLEAKRSELEDWLARREAFALKAEENVVAIYARMRPDAAAAQLVAMEDGTAAALLAKLNPRIASAILNEMEAGKAAALTHAMAGQSTDDAEEERL
jgi:flagellar motility protein MotE (MotC chaperone)